MRMTANLLVSTVLIIVAGSANADGKETYDGKCAVCHAGGIANAPKIGDKDAWAPRIAAGTDSLLATVTTGKGAMPPKGGCTDCSEADLKAAIQYMVDNSK